MTAPTPDQALGICRSNMFKLIRIGAIDTVQIGRLRRITPSALEMYVASMSGGNGSAA